MIRAALHSAKQNYKDLKIKNKLLYSYFSLIFLPIIIVSSFAYFSFSYYFQKNVIDYNVQIINQLNKNIENNIEYMDNMGMFVSYNSDIQYFIKNSSGMSIEEKYKAEYKIEELLINLTSFNPLVSSIYIYGTDNKEILRVNKVNDFLLDVFPEDKEWYADFLKDKSYKKFFLLKDTSGNLDYCVGRKIIDRVTKKTIGIVVLSCDVSTISKLADNFYFGPEGALKILDSENNLVYITNDYERKSDYQQVLTYVPETAGNYTENINGHSMLVSNNKSTYTGWSITCFVPVKYINRDINIILRIILIVSFGCLILMAVISNGIAKGIAGPIIKLEKKMQKVKEGDLSTQIVVDRKDEIGRLSSEFNDMTKRINELFTTIYQSRLNEREAELSALQAQINPHFLYNTLESIRTLASLNDDYDTAKMITALGKFLRLKIHNNKRTISVEQEVEHARSYIMLMQMKLKNIEFIVDIEPDIGEYKIVKLILQPIIENAIYHGLREKGYNGTISIAGRVEADKLVFIISDDGAGMTPDELKGLCRRINHVDEDDENFGSIGLKNVQNRLKLIFGREYGLEIESAKNRGTIVIVKIPIEEF